MRSSFPFINQQNSLVLLRCGLALIFFLHAIVRLLNGTIERFAEFLTEKNFPEAIIIVWALTIYEIIGSMLLAMNIFSSWLCAGFIFILLVGIVVIHFPLGWFVGEHSTGGVEYSFLIILALLAISTERKV